MISSAVILAIVGLTKSVEFFKGTEVNIRISWLLAALGALIIYQVLNAGMWAGVLKSLGADISYAKGARMWIETECGKWLPGGVFGYGSRVVTAPEYGISKVLSGKGLTLELVTTVMAWATVSLLIFTTPFFQEILEKLALVVSGIPVVPLVFAGLTIMALGIFIGFKVPKIRTKALEVWALRNELGRIAPAIYVKYLILCLWNGVTFWLLSKGFTEHSITVWQMVGIGGVAWLGGFFAIGVPGGIGVREGILVWLLSHKMATSDAVLIAMSWRMLQVLVELSVLGLSLLLNHIFKRKSGDTEKHVSSKIL